MNLTDEILLVLAGLFGHTKGTIAVRLRSMAFGVDQFQHYDVPGMAQPFARVPLPMLQAYAAKNLEITAKLVVDRSDQPTQLGAAVVTLPIELAPRAAVLARLEAFRPAPPIVLDAVTSAIGIWPLSEPADLVVPDTHERAGALLRHLAEALGAPSAADVDPLAAFVMLPGSAIRNAGQLPIRAATCVRVTDERFPVERLEAAIKEAIT